MFLTEPEGGALNQFSPVVMGSENEIVDTRGPKLGLLFRVPGLHPSYRGATRCSMSLGYLQDSSHWGDWACPIGRRPGTCRVDYVLQQVQERPGIHRELEELEDMARELKVSATFHSLLPP